MALDGIGETNYKIWQQSLATSKTFRYFWQFWSNYAFIFYIVAAVYLVSSDFIVPLVILSLASFVFARLIITALINLVYKKQRPYQKFNFNPITSRFFSLQTKIPNSFPSRHTISFVAVAVSVAVFAPVVGFGLLIATAFTGAGRVVLGYHWPTDIMTGLILGSITGYLVTTIGLAMFFT